jgi:hypothetical protein
MSAVYQAQAALKRIRRRLTHAEEFAANTLLPPEVRDQDPHGYHALAQAYYTRLVAEWNHRDHLLEQVAIAKAYFHDLDVEDNLLTLAFQFVLLNSRCMNSAR